VVYPPTAVRAQGLRGKVCQPAIAKVQFIAKVRYSQSLSQRRVRVRVSVSVRGRVRVWLWTWAIADCNRKTR